MTLSIPGQKDTFGLEDSSQEKYIRQANNFESDTDLASYIAKRVSMENFKHFNPAVGVDNIQFVGLPGSGKTSFSMRVTKDLAKERGENILIGGDIFCEFRHYLRYPRIFEKIWFFYPNNHDLFYYNIPNKGNEPDDSTISKKYGLEFESKQVDLNKFDIRDYLTNDTKATVFVIYDNHYYGRDIWRRAEFWKRQTKNLLQRTVLIDDTAITTLYNEAGTLWKEGASGKHWDQIDEFAEISVEDRKGLVRRINNSQLETEIYHPIRKKDLYKVYRLGTTSKFVHPLVRKVAPFQSRSHYILTYGGMFRIGNTTFKLTELKEKWKIIPQGDLDVSDEIDDSKSKNGYSLKIKAGVMKLKHYHNLSDREISRTLSINRESISRWSKDEQVLQYMEKLV